MTLPPRGKINSWGVKTCILCISITDILYAYSIIVSRGNDQRNHYPAPEDDDNINNDEDDGFKKRWKDIVLDELWN